MHTFRAICLLAAATATVMADDKPYIAGFERFHEDASDDVAGGKLLLGELQCLACHTARGVDGSLHRQAPNLKDIGRRADANFLRDFILEPHKHQPGSTMPRMMNELPNAERRTAATAIVNYLLSTGNRFQRTPPDLAAVQRGNTLYHTIGCVACHVPLSDDVNPQVVKQSRPFPNMESKYSHAGLQRFLSNPLAVRPSGRMPHMNLVGREASDIAHYLLRRTKVSAPLKYDLFHGRRRNLKDEGKLELAKTGNAEAFNLEFPHRNSNYTVRLHGFLNVPQQGEYTFHLSADDGAYLSIDEKQVIDNDSPRSNDKVRVAKATLNLTAGSHAIAVDYFQRGREQILKLEWEGPDIARQEIPAAVLSNEAAPLEPVEPIAPWQFDAAQVPQGKALFLGHGCNSCHQLEPTNDLPKSDLLAANLSGGCLKPGPSGSNPNYGFSDRQTTAITAAVDALKQPAQSKSKTGYAHTLKLLNCYACHERDKVGGVPDNRRSLFATTSIELGDEGRIPPSISGVGDKLNPEWLKQVLTNRGIARPYMTARMPQFGEKQVGHLPAAFVMADRTKQPNREPSDQPATAKEVALRLIDKGKLQCIACHDFNGHESIGIRAMDLTTMPQRLNRDWFHRYMLNPTAYRPGTKMPASWPNGRSLFKDELDSDAFRQIDAIWTYLSDGRKAIPPKGLNRKSLEVIVGGEAVVYRNKIREAGFRGICVGHPEQVNFSFDAVSMRMAQIWKGRFLNAAPHWNSNGMGRIGPLGSDVITFAKGGPFARLSDADAAWPEQLGKEAGYQFQGYDLGELQRPTFRYWFTGANITDGSTGIENGNSKTLRRTLTVTGGNTRDLWFRVWAGEEVVRDGDIYRCDKKLRVRLNADGVTRENNGRTELLVPVQFAGGKATIMIDYEW